jgi:O-acetylserine/cysteine efflux transporter
MRSIAATSATSAVAHAARPTNSHLLLAVLIAVVWGLNFPIIHFGLAYLPPLLFVALRFGVAALVCFFVPRPRLPLTRVAAAGLIMLTGQFTFLFLAMRNGMPAGLASVVMQAQAAITIALAAVLQRELPTRAQFIALLLAVGGLILIACDLDATTSLLGFALTMCSATCWATGNQIVRTMRPASATALMAWMSLFAAPPALLASLLLEPWPSLPDAHGCVVAGLSVLFNGVLATLFGFGSWAWLLARYKAATVAPFSLLVPVIGASSSAWLLGESFSNARLAGMALLVLGVGGSVFGAARR